MTSTFDDGAPARTTPRRQILARTYSSMLIRGIGENSQSQARLGQPFVIETRAGGDAMTGNRGGGKSESDGYTPFFTVVQAQDGFERLFPRHHLGAARQPA
jgi:hypothetical protein